MHRVKRWVFENVKQNDSISVLELESVSRIERSLMKWHRFICVKVVIRCETFNDILHRSRSPSKSSSIVASQILVPARWQIKSIPWTLSAFESTGCYVNKADVEPSSRLTTFYAIPTPTILIENGWNGAKSDVILWRVKTIIKRDCYETDCKKCVKRADECCLSICKNLQWIFLGMKGEDNGRQRCLLKRRVRLLSMTRLVCHPYKATPPYGPTSLYILGHKSWIKII